MKKVPYKMLAIFPGKIPALESLFNEVAGLFKNTYLKNICERRLQSNQFTMEYLSRSIT